MQAQRDAFVTKGVAARLVAMTVAIGILAPFEGGKYLAAITGWILVFYLVGLFCKGVAHFVPSFKNANEYAGTRSITVRDITTALLVDIVPWVFIVCGAVLGGGRIVGLTLGIWAN